MLSILDIEFVSFNMVKNVCSSGTNNRLSQKFKNPFSISFSVRLKRSGHQANKERLPTLFREWIPSAEDFVHVLCFDLQLEESYRRTSSRMFLYILSWISMIFHVIFLTLALGMFKEFRQIRYLCNALKAESPFARVFFYLYMCLLILA